MRKIAVISIVLCVLIPILLCGCGGYVNYKNKKADDELSKLINETLGADVYYISKEDAQGILVYDYLLKREDKEVIKEFILAVDEALSQSAEKTIVGMYYQIPGGLESTITLRNYSDNTLYEINLDEAKRIDIVYPHVSECELFKDMEIYTVLENVQFLYIEKEMQDLAEEQGIDWYEVWPTLEEMWIVSGSEKIKVERDMIPDTD